LVSQFAPPTQPSRLWRKFLKVPFLNAFRLATKYRRQRLLYKIFVAKQKTQKINQSNESSCLFVSFRSCSFKFFQVRYNSRPIFLFKLSSYLFLAFCIADYPLICAFMLFMLFFVANSFFSISIR